MAAIALILIVVGPALDLGARVVIQRRRVGSSGLSRLHADSAIIEGLATLCGLLYVVALLLAPVADLFGWLDPIGSLNITVVNVVGLTMFCTGTPLVFLVQMSMGDSWGIGAEPGESTALLTTGVFAIVRNPIYALAFPVTLGYVLMIPNWVSVAAFLFMVAGLELMVRGVEEPHLLKDHGDAYREYASRVGRFLPGVGLLG